MSDLKIVIVDDEKRIRSSLAKILKLHFANAIVVGEAGNIEDALKVIQEQSPDVVLLDIKMPGGTGFDLLKQLMPLSFKVIFITAYDQFAINAFKFSAVDYLLKPVIPQELVEALNRIEEFKSENESKKLKVLLDDLNESKKESKKIVLNTQGATHIIDVNEIIRCEADRNYTLFILKNKKNILVSGGLKEYDDMLSSFNFIRSHHSHLINLFFVERLDKRDGGILIMKDGSEVPVSVRKYPEIMSALNKM